MRSKAREFPYTDNGAELCAAYWSVNRAWLTNPVETDRGTVKEAVPVWESVVHSLDDNTSI